MLSTNQQVLSDIVVWSKYSKYIPQKQRRENWAEIVTRNAEMHMKKFPDLTDLIFEQYMYVLDKKVVPSMRSIQFAGKPVELMPSRLFNCAYTAIDDYRAFSEIMFLLLGGSGVGYSVQNRHIKQLPPIQPPHHAERYVIQDSIVGWSDAIKRLMKSYFFGTVRPLFDFGDIRQKGARLNTTGGTAPGPEPLKKTLSRIQEILVQKEYGSRLSSVEVFDIICHIAEGVLSGGIRRSATICYFDHDDEKMLASKSGEWWVQHSQRAMANTSVVLDRRRLTAESFQKVFEITRYSKSGEPGFFLTNDPDICGNPCNEISLQNCGMCNLSEIDISTVVDEADLEARLKAATFIGTLQASYTDFWYLRPEWRRRAEDDALIGVSLTGLASLPDWVDLEKSAQIVKDYNQYYASLIGINPAKRLTTVKPSGTTSLVLGTASGIHAYYAPFYIRRMQLNKSEALYRYVKDKVPELVEDYYLKPSDTAVLSIPIKAPEGSVFRDEGALAMLDRIHTVQTQWIDNGHINGLNKNNVSCTVNVKEDEWDTVSSWMWKNRDSYAGMSLLPYDNGTYKQAPFEEINEATYEELSKHITKIDLTEIQEEEDQTDLAGEIACGGGACEIGKV